MDAPGYPGTTLAWFNWNSLWKTGDLNQSRFLPFGKGTLRRKRRRVPSLHSIHHNLKVGKKKKTATKPTNGLVNGEPGVYGLITPTLQCVMHPSVGTWNRSLPNAGAKFPYVMNSMGLLWLCGSENNHDFASIYPKDQTQDMHKLWQTILELTFSTTVSLFYLGVENKCIHW